MAYSHDGGFAWDWHPETQAQADQKGNTARRSEEHPQSVSPRFLLGMIPATAPTVACKLAHVIQGRARLLVTKESFRKASERRDTQERNAHSRSGRGRAAAG